MFFVTTSGLCTESALPFLNLLDILTADNVYHLHALKFTHLWHKGFLPKVFDNLWAKRHAGSFNRRETWIYRSLLETWYCCVGRVGRAVSQLDIMSTPRGLNPRYRGISAAYNSLHLILELPVQQSVYKRIDSRIKQHHCIRNDAVHGETNVEGCSKKLHVVDHCAHKPTDSEYGSDNYDHQGYSLSNPYDALCIERRRVLLKWQYLHNLKKTKFIYPWLWL